MKLSKSKAVESASFIDLAKSFLDGISKGWDMLKSWGLEVEQNEKEKANNVWSIKLGNDETMQCKVDPIDKTGSRVDLTFTNTKTNKKKTFKDVKRNADKWYQLATEAAEALYGPATVEEFFNRETGESIEDKDTSNDASSSTHMKIQLSKIQCSKGYDVLLHKIMCGTDIKDPSVTLEAILKNAEFTNTLTEKPECFDVCENGDELSVDKCEVFEIHQGDIAGNLSCLMRKAISIMITLRYWKWNCCGSEMRGFRDSISEVIWMMEDHIEQYATWIFQCTGAVGDMYSSSEVGIQSMFDKTCCKTMSDDVYRMLDNYISLMNCLYCNFPHEIATAVDMMINRTNSLKSSFSPNCID